MIERHKPGTVIALGKIGTVVKSDGKTYFRQKYAEYNLDGMPETSEIVSLKKEKVVAKFQALIHTAAETTGLGIERKGERTLHDVVDEWEAYRLAQGGPENTLRNVRANCKKIRTLYPNWPIRKIDTPDLRDASEATAAGRNAVKTLKQIFSYAVEKRYIGRNPASREAKFKPKDYDTTPRRVVSPEQYDRLVAAARTPVELLAARLFFILGTRIGELCGLHRADYKRAEALFYLERQSLDYGIAHRLKSKSGMSVGLFDAIPARRVKLGSLAVQWIEEYLAWLDSTGYTGPWLFVNEDGEPWTPKQFRATIWNGLLIRSGIGKYVPHEARHTHITYRVLLRDSYAWIAAEVGQSSMSITEKYTHYTHDIGRVVPGEITRVIGRVPGEFEGVAGG